MKLLIPVTDKLLIAVIALMIACGGSGTPTDESEYDSNTDLAVLTLAETAISPDFVATTLDYTATVPYTTAAVTVTATASGSNATLDINGENSPHVVSLTEGDNLIVITVTAEDGTEKSYNLTVNRTPGSTENRLSGLSLSTGILNPSFSQDLNEYNVLNSNSVTSVSVTATLVSASSSLKINEVPSSSGIPSSGITTSVGKNVITASVTAENGSINNYIINIYRAGLPIINGSISSNEYGIHTDKYNSGVCPASLVWYMSWDNTNLYVAVSTADVNQAALIYIDKNPSANTGASAGFTYDGSSFSPLPFKADFVAYFKNGYREYRTYNSSWSAATPAFGSYLDNGSNVREVLIPWTLLGGRPDSFSFFVYVVSSGGFVTGQYPTGNPSGSIGTSAVYKRYCFVSDTNKTTETEGFPFHNQIVLP